MSTQHVNPATPHPQVNYIFLFESATGMLYSSYRSVPEGQDPEDFAADLVNAYKQHTNHLKHIFYRGVLFKKPLVSIAKLSEAGRPFPTPLVPDVAPHGPLRQIPNLGAGHLFVQDHVYDATLTAAMKNATVLRNIDRDTFYEMYDEVVVKAGDSTPRAAILMHLEDDRAASGVFRIASSIVSITMGLVGFFAF
ncbi:uncharacterized protein NECHADRAFT_54681 [Fusarium vanettenii 77-13-4]|uniref:Uncharacterized protein n=1 Tax=Fusarium vanettenii (strain ATCC MYA-4622 / CBS 123669 / FGSC 9596 / NRRL 45880 / 77-13-4) TaxID=660122 RepID=C7ZE09_FUSV7|nr:uncharacterized protein NECHADRAFT_54681 [Fusarium vanettenii 77-13-4]EEU37937.1 hypothetical protein NECHADRAFT_54681 [Fusarium vanettenii 77-13-4]